MIVTYLIKEDPVFKTQIDVRVDDCKIIDFRAYSIYFDPMGKRRRPITMMPCFVSQSDINKARQYAKALGLVRETLVLSSTFQKGNK